MPNDLYKKADDKTEFRPIVERTDPYMEFRGPGDRLKEQTENLARSNAREAGAYRTTRERTQKRTSRR